jgi:flagellar hook-associated protein 1 FlgK
MSLLEALTVSGQAMQAQTYGSRIASNNIANVNTQGYARQTARLDTNPSPLLGVRATGVQRNFDTIIGNRLRQQTGNLADAQARQAYASRIETDLDPNGDGGIQNKLDAFFSSMRTLQSSPTDANARQSVLATADALTKDVNAKYTSLTQTRTDINNDITATVKDANALANQVAKLNKAIGAARGTPQQDSAIANLSDQRDVALQKLSQLVGGTAILDDSGQATVSVGGFAIVAGDSVRPLVTTVDSNGDAHISVDAAGQPNLDSRLGSSKASGLLTMRSDVQARIDELDQFTQDFTAAVNTQHGAGYGLDGSTGSALFTTGAKNGAASFALDPAMVGQPNRLAIASTGGAVGDSGNAKALVALESSLGATGGTQTFAQSLASSITAAGLTKQSADTSVTTEQAQYEQINDAVLSASGVSLDEEMLSLESYQRAYQAAAKVVSTVNDMLDTLLNM